MSAGGIFFLIIIVVTFGITYMAAGVVMDKFTEVSNDLVLTGGFPTSEARQQAMNYQLYIWGALPIIIVLMVSVWLIKNAIRKQGGVA